MAAQPKVVVQKAKGTTILKMVYLYILSFVGIIITVTALIGMVNLVLRNYVFQVPSYDYYSEMCRQPKLVSDKNVTPTEAEIATCEKDEKRKNDERVMNDTKREIASQVAAIFIGLPLWLYHWGLIRKEKE